MAAVDPIWVNFSVSQNQIAKQHEMLAKGEVLEPKDRHYEVELVLSDGARYPHRGRISFADPSFSQETGSFQVRGVLPNPQMDLRPGMFVTARLHGAVRPPPGARSWSRLSFQLVPSVPATPARNLPRRTSGASITRRPPTWPTRGGGSSWATPS